MKKSCLPAGPIQKGRHSQYKIKMKKLTTEKLTISMIRNDHLMVLFTSEAFLHLILDIGYPVGYVHLPLFD